MPVCRSFRRALPVVLSCVAVQAAVPSAASASGCADANAHPASIGPDRAAAAVLCLVNEHRSAGGLGTLAAEETLTSTARAYARDMVERRYFSHTPPEGTSTEQKLEAYWRGWSWWTVGENLAWGADAEASPRATVDNWLRSETHRENVFKGGYAQAGVGAVAATPSGGSGATYAMHFGNRAGYGADGASPRSAPPSTKPRKTRASCLQRAKRRKSASKRRKAARWCRKAYRR